MKEGTTLNATQQSPTVMSIANLSTMTVETQISEADVGKLWIGMDVYFNTSSGGTRRWYSTLRQILPTPTATNNVVTYTGLFDVENGDGALLSGMTTQVYFVTSAARGVLTVPVGALKFADAPRGAEGAMARAGAPGSMPPGAPAATGGQATHRACRRTARSRRWTAVRRSQLPASRRSAERQLAWRRLQRRARRPRCGATGPGAATGQGPSRQRRRRDRRTRGDGRRHEPRHGRSDRRPHRRRASRGRNRAGRGAERRRRQPEQPNQIFQQGGFPGGGFPGGNFPNITTTEVVRCPRSAGNSGASIGAPADDRPNLTSRTVAIPLIELQGVSRTFVTDGGVEVRALRGIDLAIYPGEFLAIMGQSGSGKSTLMNILGCLDRPTDGTYLFAGRDIQSFDADGLAWLRREAFGFVFQSYNLLAAETAKRTSRCRASTPGCRRPSAASARNRC